MIENSYTHISKKQFCISGHLGKALEVLPSFCDPLIDAARPEKSQAVFYGIGYCQAVQVTAVTVWFWVIEDRAYIFPVVEIIEILMC